MIRLAFKGELGTTSQSIIMLSLFSTIFIVIAAFPFLFLTKLNKPIGTLTRGGFSGLRNQKTRTFPWTPNTVFYGGTRLANLNPNQSRKSAIWLGVKAEVVINHFFVKETEQEIREAIEWLSPYPVKQTSLYKVLKS